MGTSYRFVAYGIIILVLSAVLLTWIAHVGSTGHKAEPPKAVAIPSAESSPLQNPRSGPHEEERSSGEPDARSAPQPSYPEVGAPSDDPYLPPSFSTPSDGEASPSDSDQSSSPSKGESAEQHFIRRLKRHS